MDLDVEHYTTDELTELLNLDEEYDRNTIIKSTENEIEKHSTKPDIVKFYKNVQKKLLETLPSENVGRTFITEVKRGTINPDTKNTITRIINIDSSARLLASMSNYLTDDFVCELSDPLLNVVSMTLLSIEIPMGWHTFSGDKGTATFILSINTIIDDVITGQVSIPIVIPDGNYALLTLLNYIKDKINNMTNANANVQSVLENFTYVYNNVSGRLTFSSSGAFTIIWYDKHHVHVELNNSTLNNNVGKLFGFILPVSVATGTIDSSGQTIGPYTMTSSSLVDISGTKYIMLSINDYLQNRINTNIIGLNTLPKSKNKTPSYYSTDITQYKTGPTNVAITPNAFVPQSKINTINSINEIIVPPKISSCESHKMFAKIPVKRVDWAKFDSSNPTQQISPDMGPVKLMVDMSGPLQLNTREYFGPVNLSMLEFSLYDDKGNLLGLNGLDWSCSLIVKSVYQY
jgi:hypothetical protein